MSGFGNAENSRKGKGTKSFDIAWDHGTSIPGNPFGVQCNYCKQVMKSGGITRLKEHLGHMGNNVRNCPAVPKDVRIMIRQLLQQKASGKRAQKEKEKEIAAQLGGDTVDVDDSEDDEDIAVEGFDPSQLRRAMKESRATQWERDQEIRLDRSRPSFHESTREHGGGSMAGEYIGSRGKKKGLLKKMMSRSGSVRDRPHKLYEEYGGIQKKMTHMWDKGKDGVKMLGQSVAKFFIHGAVPANLADSIPFKNMIHTAQTVGRGVDPPSQYMVMNRYLEEEVGSINEWIKSQHHSWENYGVSIMCDGWTGPTKLSIINMMLYCKGTSVFCRSIDASANIKDATYIKEQLRKQIEWVGKKVHIVQIITDNGSAFKKAGKELEKEYPLYWTPCAAHCIDLILEDIGRRSSIRAMITDGRRVTKFLYNHNWILRMFHDESNYTNEIVRPDKTRFTTNFIALDSLWKARRALNIAFNSNA